MNQCPRCKERGQTWSGRPPVCAFRRGEFDANNWNCATANALRDLCEVTCWSEDQYAGLIPFDGQFIYLEWYKSRGATDLILFMPFGEPLALEDAESILEDLL